MPKTLRKTIPLSTHEVELLKELYLQKGIPSDQYAKRPVDLAEFIAQWNAMSERNDTAGEVLHYIKSKRRHKLWPTFGGMHQRMAEWQDGVLYPAEWEALRAVYEAKLVPLGMGSDNLAYDEALAKQCAQEFARLTGRIVSGQTLLALIMAKRKRGDWITLSKLNHEAHKSGDTPSIGFGDIDQIAI